MKLNQKTKKQVKFVILARLPSYHELTAGTTRQVQGAIKRSFMDTFFFAIKEGIQKAKDEHGKTFRYIGNTSYFPDEVKIDLTIFGRWQGPPDRDNYIQSAGKLIIDQLFSTKTRYAAVNLLVDDRFVEWGKVEFPRGDPKVEITIEDLS